MTVAPANAVEQHIAQWIEDAAAGVMADQAAELAAKDALIADLDLALSVYSGRREMWTLTVSEKAAITRALTYIDV